MRYRCNHIGCAGHCLERSTPKLLNTMRRQAGTQAGRPVRCGIREQHWHTPGMRCQVQAWRTNHEAVWQVIAPPRSLYRPLAPHMMSACILCTPCLWGLEGLCLTQRQLREADALIQNVVNSSMHQVLQYFFKRCNIISLRCRHRRSVVFTYHSS
jgi:hypothetical protein